MAGQRLTRDLQHSMLGGVCAGFANRYDFDVTLIRVVMVLFTVATGGIGVPLYVAAWIVMPREDASQPAPRPMGDSPDSLSRELREVSDRLSEAARVLADKTREAAEEISEIARRARTSETSSSAGGWSVTDAVEGRAEAAEHAPDATRSEAPDMANSRESDVDESLSTSTPPPPTGSGGHVLSDQSPHPPPPRPAGPVPPAPPAP
ncbi:MAG: PspC domain-containing protein [Chloroflexota bacterium]